jgi:hypothetical protein
MNSALRMPPGVVRLAGGVVHDADHPAAPRDNGLAGFFQRLTAKGRALTGTAAPETLNRCYGNAGFPETGGV